MASWRTRIEGAIVAIACIAIAVFYLVGSKPWHVHTPRTTYSSHHSTGH